MYHQIAKVNANLFELSESESESQKTRMPESQKARKPESESFKQREVVQKFSQEALATT